jgi:DNA-binding response OmpR family regulator
MDPKNYTILVAEDEEASRFLYEEELKDEGYKVLAAENGLQVLGYLEDVPVDLLMTDVKMPDMHALEMIPRIRVENKELPILVLSAFKGMENDFTLQGAGIQGFFAKPVNMSVLKDKIRDLLKDRPPQTKVI